MGTVGPDLVEGLLVPHYLLENYHFYKIFFHLRLFSHLEFYLSVLSLRFLFAIRVDFA